MVWKPLTMALMDAAADGVVRDRIARSNADGSFDPSGAALTTKWLRWRIKRG